MIIAQNKKQAFLSGIMVDMTCFMVKCPHSIWLIPQCTPIFISLAGLAGSTGEIIVYHRQKPTEIFDAFFLLYFDKFSKS